MVQNSTAGLVALLTTYGYWAVFACIAIESTGIPFPGETMLLVAAIYAGTTHQLSIVLIIAAAESFAILGDNLGFWVGREGGYRLLRRFGPLVCLNERKLKLGLYLFRRHGVKWSSSAALWRCCACGRRSWPEPIAWSGNASCSSTRLQAWSGLQATAWEVTSWVTICRGSLGRLAWPRSWWQRSASARSWSSCAATKGGWKRRRSGPCLAPWSATTLALERNAVGRCKDRPA